MYNLTYLMTRLINSNNFSAVYCFYVLSIAALIFSLLKISRMDCEKRKKGEKRLVNLGRIKRIFITEAKEKGYILKSTLILELVVYVCLLITASLAAISWFCEVQFVSLLSWFYFLSIAVFTGVIYIAYIKVAIPSNIIY